MIVRNEAHVVHEVLTSVAPYISSWVIVDTGSDDGTQDVIRNHMAALGIPGELHERAWHGFGHNRTEALALAQGHGDYIWVIDADDIVIGTPDFTQLVADIYLVRRRHSSSAIFWRPELFRDGVRARWVGVTHEYATCDDPQIRGVHLEGDYHIADRQLSSRNASGQKFAQDRDLLLEEVERNPEDARSVFYLAQSYFDLGDFANARKWYARRIEMGGWDQEAVYYAMLRVAETMAKLDMPWPDVQHAYLKAWGFRPTRAEALYAIAVHYRVNNRYQLGYLFAERAAQIPLPETDNLFVLGDIYSWLAVDEQAVCASWIGKHAEAFILNRRLLAQPDIPDQLRPRFAQNRDFSVPAMIEAASSYPDVLADSLVAGPADAEITVSLTAGPDRAATERTLNSFLHCCTDVARVGRFLILDAGLSAQDRALLQQRYRFIECAPTQPGAQLARLREQIHGRFWLHLGQGWQFFAPENFITRLTTILDAEPQVFQVGVNFADATKLTGTCAPEAAVRRTPDTGRYVLTDLVASGPAMIDTNRLAQPAGLGTASLDEVLCVTTP
jgi:glycosyltransferase involved in cell wall biosynthesis